MYCSVIFPNAQTSCRVRACTYQDSKQHVIDSKCQMNDMGNKYEFGEEESLKGCCINTYISGKNSLVI